MIHCTDSDYNRFQVKSQTQNWPNLEAFLQQCTHLRVHEDEHTIELKALNSLCK